MSINLSIFRIPAFTRIFNCKSPLRTRSIKVRMSTLTEADSGVDTRKGPGLLAILNNRPKRLRRIKFLSELFKASGYELRIAGGAVRDILRGTEPQDIDFATTARPEQSLEILKPHDDLLRIIVTASGQKHGTVAVKFKEVELDFKRIKLSHSTKQTEPVKTNADNKPEYDEESPYEITTLRCDKFTDGRHAEVEFINDWRLDAERRDLTINAMFLTLDEGKLIDYFDGETDLKNGIVRFVGDADLRIREDYLRILRFFRFWSRYGRKNIPDQETTDIIQKNLGGLDGISGERLWVEVKKTLSYLPCYEVLELMLNLKLFQHVGLVDKDLNDYDEYVRSTLEQAKLVQTNVQEYTKTVLDNNQKDQSTDPVHRRMKDLLPVILFASAVKTYDMCMNACERMKFSNLEKDSILYVVENRTKNATIKAFKYQLATAHVPERAQTLNRMRALLIYQGKFEYINQLESWQIPTFPITGQLVSQEVRKRKLPGNKIKTFIEALKEDWANSDYSLSKEELEQRMTSLLDKS